ncbi:unnamed protein product [Parnassius apollo]|uniref:(apollo) hypothetical protein n=1 Tax=Parnassius apollo TaxID=110799 RepID=A0A8S3YC30_PARAO|nr:unnamed protein product [Parnassius apollo]
MIIETEASHTDKSSVAEVLAAKSGIAEVLEAKSGAVKVLAAKSGAQFTKILESMRRKSERSATKKKASPEKKVEKLKRTRSRRRKSTSSENESGEESKVKQEAEVTNVVEQNVEQTAKTDSPEESQEQVWQVKAADGSGDSGELQKIKICLTRPPSTPERVDKSPRSRRKHSRTTSFSDSQTGEGPEEKKKSRLRSKHSTSVSSENSDKTDIHLDEPQKECTSEKNLDTEIQEPTDVVSQSQSNEENTMNEKREIQEPTDVMSQSQLNEEKTMNERSDIKDSRDVMPQSQSNERRTISDENISACIQSETETSTLEEINIQNKIDVDATKESENDKSCEDKDKQNYTDKESEKKSPERERSMSIDKSEVLEIHAEESKGEISDLGISESQNEVNNVDPESHEEMSTKERELDKVSINEDKSDKNILENTESSQNELQVSTNETDVVAKCEIPMSDSPKNTADSTSSTHNVKSIDSRKKLGNSESTQSSNEDNVHNGHNNTVINRKRRWGSRTSKLTSQKSITISTDVLKEIIPDVKLVEFDEVIEEKKQHKRVEVVEKVERPILPKIIIDNTENVEQNKREQEDKDKENMKLKEPTSLASTRKISIVKDSDNIAIVRPPSPPRHKQSNILYITNLVRPFTLSQLKNLLQRTGRIVENGFWIDRIKSKCYVIYETEDQAVETRHALHGVTWPVSNPKTLHVDFSTQEEFDKAKANEETDNAKASTMPGTVEDWLREQDLKRERGELDKPWERKTMREWDVGKNDKGKEQEKEKLRRDDRSLEKRRHHTPERSPEPAKKFKKKEEAPAKLLDDLFRKTKTTPCIYWLPLSAETIAIKEEQRRQHMAEHERRLQELRRTHRRH